MPIITILEHQARWNTDFEAIESELRTALGSLALAIDHIGSTAVLGLCAKDVIDIQVTVQSLDTSVVQTLTKAGFTTHNSEAFRQDHVPPEAELRPEHWSKLFFMQRLGARRSNIHIRQIGRPNRRYALLVRDFLRADKRSANAYGELKRRLAVALTDPDAYPEVKDPASDLIYFAAERWALQTQWQLNKTPASEV